MSDSLENNVHYQAYLLAIKARNIHYENFEKWMTFYYVSVGAILVAFYTIHTSTFFNLLLPFLGFIISIFWHLSCKGFKYWTDNWINVIFKFEAELNIPSVYSIFSNDVFNRGKRNSVLNGSNISTPRLTLLFSFVICTFWIFVFLRNMFLIIFHYVHVPDSCFIIMKLLYYLIALFFSPIISYIVIYILNQLGILNNDIIQSHELF